jgi:hypothetical protein
LTEDATELLRGFMHDHLSSFEELEALLFLARAPEQAFSRAELGAALRLPDDSLQSALDSLSARGDLIEHDFKAEPPRYRYAPAADVRDRIGQLQRLYDEQPVTVLRIMSSNALDRVRHAAARRLADAFRLDRSKK